MGSELFEGQWDVQNELDWQSLHREEVCAFANYRRALNLLYCGNSALYEADYEPWSTRWLCCDDGGNGVYAMIRHSRERHVAAIWNFSAETRDHSFPLPYAQSLHLILHTLWQEFGGNLPKGEGSARLENGVVSFSLPPLSGMVLEICFQ